MEESEIFVPGASKQILDNLAKENARLRNQIKNSENINLKKQGEVCLSFRVYGHAFTKFLQESSVIIIK